MFLNNSTNHRHTDVLKKEEGSTQVERRVRIGRSWSEHNNVLWEMQSLTMQTRNMQPRIHVCMHRSSLVQLSFAEMFRDGSQCFGPRVRPVLTQCRLHLIVMRPVKHRFINRWYYEVRPRAIVSKWMQWLQIRPGNHFHCRKFIVACTF